MGKERSCYMQAHLLSTNYHVHLLNLACYDWIKNAVVTSKLLRTSHEITKLVKSINENEENCSIKIYIIKISGVRWTVRAGSLASLYENYLEVEKLWRWCLTEYKSLRTESISFFCPSTYIGI